MAQIRRRAMRRGLSPSQRPRRRRRRGRVRTRRLLPRGASRPGGDGGGPEGLRRVQGGRGQGDGACSRFHRLRRRRQRVRRGAHRPGPRRGRRSARVPATGGRQRRRLGAPRQDHLRLPRGYAGAQAGPRRFRRRRRHDSAALAEAGVEGGGRRRRRLRRERRG